MVKKKIKFGVVILSDKRVYFSSFLFNQKAEKIMKYKITYITHIECVKKRMMK